MANEFDLNDLQRILEECREYEPEAQCRRSRLRFRSESRAKNRQILVVEHQAPEGKRYPRRLHFSQPRRRYAVQRPWPRGLPAWRRRTLGLSMGSAKVPDLTQPPRNRKRWIVGRLGLPVQCRVVVSSPTAASEDVWNGTFRGGGHRP